MALSGRTTVVTGYAEVYADTGSGFTWDNLCVTVNGIHIVEQRFHSPVPGDENGGEEGPPVDKQFMGALDMLQIDASKVNLTALDVIRTRAMASAVTGAIGTPGTLLISGGYYTQILILAAGFTRNYPIVLFSEPMEFNLGTKYSRFRLAGEAHRDLPSLASQTSNTMWVGSTASGSRP